MVVGGCVDVLMVQPAEKIRLSKWDELPLPVRCIFIFLQLAKSSLAIHGGAIFSAVCGWKSILISAPEPYKHRECCRLLVFPPGATFFLPYTCTLLPLFSGHFKWICAEAGHMDLFLWQIHVTCFSTNPFEMPTEQRKQCACEWRAKKKLLLVEKQAAYSILCAYMVLEH